MHGLTPLSDLQIGCYAIIKEITSTGSIRRRLQDMGFVEGTKVECVLKSPFGDPIAYEIKGTLIALRNEDSSCVYIEPI